jgi:high-affinity nickel permease
MLKEPEIRYQYDCCEKHPSILLRHVTTRIVDERVSNILYKLNNTLKFRFWFSLGQSTLVLLHATI